MSSIVKPAQKIPLQTESNESVTVDCNTLPIGQQKFLKRAIRINQQEGRPWSCLDFSHMSKGNFRQIVRRLKDRIEIVRKSNPCFYKVKGITLPGDSHRVTPRPMGVNQDLMEILHSLEHQPPAIHDIKLKVNASIHEGLIKRGHTPRPDNGSIVVDIPLPDENITAKALVYQNSLQIDIGCTFKPIAYDVQSLLTLHERLSNVSFFLISLSQIQLPEVKDWIITHYHFNKDGDSISGPRFHIPMGETTQTMIRFYAKIMPNGDTIPRLEEIRKPNTTFEEEMNRVIQAS